MTTDYDLVIRGAMLIDGTGADPRQADIAISNGIITKVGEVPRNGIEEIDARGLVVTPGFIDLHTHYDGQAIWSNHLNPSSSHGVTTVIMGNCGVGFAPCRPADRELLCATMEGVEDIPGVVMDAGLTWNWETFPDYLNAVEAQPRDIDVGMFVPHSAVRVYVMGERGANREPATDEDLSRMSEIIREGVAAGALGFSTTRTAIDRRNDGELVPSFNAAEREVVAAALAVKAAGGGLIQLLPELGMTGLTPEQEFSLMRAVSQASDLPITYTIAPARGTDLWRDLLTLTKEHNHAGGAKIYPQYFARPVGLIASFDLTSNPFVHTPTYKSLAYLPRNERISELRKPEIRNRIISEEPEAALMPLTVLMRIFDWMFEFSDPPNYEPGYANSIAARAQREGKRPEELAYDLLLKNDGYGKLLVTIANYPDETLDHLFEFFNDPHAVMGLGDGGAHYGLICDSSYPTFVLAYWARDRDGRQLTPSEAIRLMTSVPAALAGLPDRGIVATGYKADLNIIDHAKLKLHAPRIVDDLPGGGRRLDQAATGYRWTIVNGKIILKDDQPTGELPGQLIRGYRGPNSDRTAATRLDRTPA